MVFSIAALAVGASAQTVTGSGSSGTIPVFTGSSTVGNSPISLSGSTFDIGTAAANINLTVDGYVGTYEYGSDGGFWMFNPAKTASNEAGTWSISNVAAGSGSSNSLVFTDYSDGTNCAGSGICGTVLTLSDLGNVGIGATNPQASLQIGSFGPYLFPGGGGAASGWASSALGFNLYRGSDNNWHTVTDGANGGGFAIYGNTSGSLYLAQVPSVGNVNQTLPDSSIFPGAIALTILNGNIGAGTANPGAKLEVNGNLKLTANSGASITFQDGTTQSTAYTGTTCGGDYAESMDVTGDRMKYAPGDVLVLDTDNPGKILKSIEPYSTAVAGIYSTKPGTVGRRQLTPKSGAEVPMAMVGIVPTKVTAENGAIHIGDLLVSSSKPGYAMKGTDRSRMLGAVIGKAMATLDSGTGTIEVLVTLQ